MLLQKRHSQLQPPLYNLYQKFKINKLSHINPPKIQKTAFKHQ